MRCSKRNKTRIGGINIRIWRTIPSESSLNVYQIFAIIFTFTLSDLYLCLSLIFILKRSRTKKNLVHTRAFHALFSVEFKAKILREKLTQEGKKSPFIIVGLYPSMNAVLKTSLRRIDRQNTKLERQRRQSLAPNDSEPTNDFGQIHDIVGIIWWKLPN